MFHHQAQKAIIRTRSKPVFFPSLPPLVPLGITVVGPACSNAVTAPHFASPTLPADHLIADDASDSDRTRSTSAVPGSQSLFSIFCFFASGQNPYSFFFGGVLSKNNLLSSLKSPTALLYDRPIM
jgi:hypothetical protein